MASSTSSFLERHEFLIRRLHSLSGLIPVGAYMCVHLVTNASVLGGADVFQGNVDKIHALGPILPLVEWTFIFIPILFHAIIGVVIVQGGLPNTSNYPTSGNIRYTLQRATGIIAFVYILAHVLHMHGLAQPLADRVSPDLFARFDPHAATSSTAQAIQTAIWVQVFYAVGIVACVFHLANGLWTMGITWGVWTSPAAQRRAGAVCSVFGVGLMVVALAALWGFMRVDVEQAQQIEEGLKHSGTTVRSEIVEAHRDVEDGSKER